MNSYKERIFNPVAEKKIYILLRSVIEQIIYFNDLELIIIVIILIVVTHNDYTGCI